LEALEGLLITRKVLNARRRGATTEAYGDIRRREERSKNALLYISLAPFMINALE
jgi:hypothetical protein